MTLTAHSLTDCDSVVFVATNQCNNSCQTSCYSHQNRSHWPAVDLCRVLASSQHIRSPLPYIQSVDRIIYTSFERCLCDTNDSHWESCIRYDLGRRCVKTSPNTSRSTPTTHHSSVITTNNVWADRLSLNI
jgi:hypothetical protein